MKARGQRRWLGICGDEKDVSGPALSHGVNGQSADVYGDGSFAAPGFMLINGQTNYTAIAQDNLSPARFSTNSVTVNVAGSANYTYDSNGNLTSDGTRNFAYNDENQLVAVWVVSAWSNNFAYDGLMRKRIEQDFAWNGSGWIETNEVHYVYDGNLVLQERDKHNEPLTTYTRGVDLSGTLQGAGGIGGLLARSDNQKIVPAILCPVNPNPQNVVTSYYFSDFDGNVAALVSPSGMILAQYEYDPFGNLISKSGLMADINKYRYSGNEWEGNAGLYYFGNRFYDPNLQRWLNRDPIQEWGGCNLFAYVNNDPFLVDLFGFQIAGFPIASTNPPVWTGPTGVFPGGFPTNPIPPNPVGGPDTNAPPARFQPKTPPSSPIHPIFGGKGSESKGKWGGGGYCGLSNKPNNPRHPNPPPPGTPSPQPEQPWDSPTLSGPPVVGGPSH